MFKLSLFSAALLLAGTAVAADPVAVIAEQEGTVLVNQGQQYVTATDAQALLPGDRVMVMKGGTASLRFTDGCVLPLDAGALLTVPAVSHCAGGVAEVHSISPAYAQAAGGAPPVSRAVKYVLVGGATVAVGAVVRNQGRNGVRSGDSPASP